MNEFNNNPNTDLNNNSDLNSNLDNYPKNDFKTHSTDSAVNNASESVGGCDNVGYQASDANTQQSYEIQNTIPFTDSRDFVNPQPSDAQEFDNRSFENNYGTQNTAYSVDNAQTGNVSADFADNGCYGSQSAPNQDTATEYTPQAFYGTAADSEAASAPMGGFISANNPYYTENIKRKPKSKSKGFIAAVLAVTVLNLSVMGGMFYMGNKFGKTGRTVASKQELMDNLKGSAENTSGATQTATSGNELSTTEIAKKVGPAVVGIKSVVQGQMTIFGTSQASESEGSGIIISEDGYIVTNNHVVDGASSISVQLNTGTEIEAKIIGKDSQTDLAVIKVEPTEELTVATLGDSNNIEVGERVVAIGNPMGLEFFGTVTQGIVSGVNRSITVDNRTMNVIQTDAAINSGNSGGALINRFGEVIGINSVKVASSGVEGMGFAIPSSEFKPIIADLLEHGYVKGRPVIGISTRDVTEYMARSYSWPQGVQVMEVSSESAKNAGFSQGDIITEVDGQKITDTESLNKIKNSHNPGDVLNMTVYKYASGKTETVQITLSEQLPS